MHISGIIHRLRIRRGRLKGPRCEPWPAGPPAPFGLRPCARVLGTSRRGVGTLPASWAGQWIRTLGFCPSANDARLAESVPRRVGIRTQRSIYFLRRVLAVALSPFTACKMKRYTSAKRRRRPDRVSVRTSSSAGDWSPVLFDIHIPTKKPLAFRARASARWKGYAIPLTHSRH